MALALACGVRRGRVGLAAGQRWWLRLLRKPLGVVVVAAVAVGEEGPDRRRGEEEGRRACDGRMVAETMVVGGLMTMMKAKSEFAFTVFFLRI